MIRLQSPISSTACVESEFITEPVHWETLIECERLACTELGYVDAGTHLLAAVRRQSEAAQ